MIIDIRSRNANTNLQQIFVEVISQQTWFHSRFHFAVINQKTQLLLCG